MTKSNTSYERAYQGAVRMAAAFSFESLRIGGWSTAELVNVMGAVQEVHTVDDDDGQTRVTVAWDSDQEVSQAALHRLNDSGELPLFLFMLSARATDEVMA